MAGGTDAAAGGSVSAAAVLAREGARVKATSPAMALDAAAAAAEKSRVRRLRRALREEEQLRDGLKQGYQHVDACVQLLQDGESRLLKSGTPSTVTPSSTPARTPRTAPDNGEGHALPMEVPALPNGVKQLCEEMAGLQVGEQQQSASNKHKSSHHHHRAKAMPLPPSAQKEAAAFRQIIDEGAWRAAVTPIKPPAFMASPVLSPVADGFGRMHVLESPSSKLRVLQETNGERLDYHHSTEHAESIVASFKEIQAMQERRDAKIARLLQTQHELKVSREVLQTSLARSQDKNKELWALCADLQGRLAAVEMERAAYALHVQDTCDVGVGCDVRLETSDASVQTVCEQQLARPSTRDAVVYCELDKLDMRKQPDMCNAAVSCELEQWPKQHLARPATRDAASYCKLDMLNQPHVCNAAVSCELEQWTKHTLRDQAGSCVPDMAEPALSQQNVPAFTKQQGALQVEMLQLHLDATYPADHGLRDDSPTATVSPVLTEAREAAAATAPVSRRSGPSNIAEHFDEQTSAPEGFIGQEAMRERLGELMTQLESLEQQLEHERLRAKHTAEALDRAAYQEAPAGEADDYVHTESRLLEGHSLPLALPAVSAGMLLLALAVLGYLRSGLLALLGVQADAPLPT
eukprot:jgi/Chlat1/7545/Chrsp62S07042